MGAAPDPGVQGVAVGAEAGGRRSVIARFAGAMRLDASVFEEVEHDAGAFAQAAAIVALGGVARGVASIAESGSAGLFVGLVTGVVLWLATSAVVWVVGVRTFAYTSDYRELLRTLGFAAAPLVLLVFCALPFGFVSTLFWWVAHGLAVAAFVLAVRQALDIDTSRALVVCVLAVGLGVVLLFLLGLFLATTAGYA